jgi:hypothetical protein
MANIRGLGNASCFSINDVSVFRDLLIGHQASFPSYKLFLLGCGILAITLKIRRCDRDNVFFIDQSFQKFVRSSIQIHVTPSLQASPFGGSFQTQCSFLAKTIPSSIMLKFDSPLF